MSAPPVVVEPATADDAASTLVLQRGVLAEGRWFVSAPDELPASLDARAREIRDFARSPNSFWLVARQGRSVVGQLTVRGGPLRRNRHTGKLAILVDARSRGAGVGRALMTACVDRATANPELTKLGLNVFADNHAAIALYRAFGFVEEGRRPREYRMDDGTYRDDVLMYRFVDG